MLEFFLTIISTMSTLLTIHKAFENTSTNVAAAQMRNALTELAETVKDPEQKKVCIYNDTFLETY